MWNDRPARNPIVGEIDRLEEMDVCLSVPELRDLLSGTGELHVARLLSGHYILEPWIRARLDADGGLHLAWGIEVTCDDGDDDGA